MKKLLVLDLDETLFHAMDQSDFNKALKQGFLKDHQDYDLEVLDCYPAIERPGVHNFLHWAFQNFTVGVWTSAGEDYANDVVKQLMIDPGHGTPLFVYSANNCVKSYINTMMPYAHYAQYHYVKDLKKLKKFGFSLQDTLIVDDSPEKVTRQYGNLVRIKPFRGDRSDTELDKLTKYLDWLKDESKFRTIEKRGWNNGY